jgi:hypothetical protein
VGEREGKVLITHRDKQTTIKLRRKKDKLPP